MATHNKFHLVLAGGGMKSISYIGCLQTLREHGIEFASVTGCSAGALVGAAVSANIDFDILKQTVDRLTTSEFRGKMRIGGPLAILFGWPRSTFEQAGVSKIINELLGTGRKLGDLEIPFATLGVDLVTKQFQIFSSRSDPDLPVSSVIEIATAMPGLYPPHEEDGKLIVDGALASACPIWMPREVFNQPEYPILAVRPRTIPAQRVKQTGIGEWMATVLELGGTSRDAYLLAKSPNTFEIEIDTGDIGFFEFNISHDSKEFLLNMGNEAATRFLTDLQEAEDIPKESIASGHADTATRPTQSAEVTHHRRIPSELRLGSRVFISYSHRDERRWLDETKTWLSASHLAREDQVAESPYFTDGDIQPGERWLERIEEAIAEADIAILLVSPAYLASSFIMNKELPMILKAQDQGLRILWIPVRLIDVQGSPLEHLQAVSNPEQPLSELSTADVDRVFRKTTRAVRDLLSTSA
ncbi:MAG: patatin-like phospholipase family protein [Gammaproteobacteria bacterium]|nr:patatin-like phospholipase family protein [Gammaproteobacteria bacterium]